jgi:hypothetical protein
VTGVQTCALPIFFIENNRGISILLIPLDQAILGV